MKPFIPLLWDMESIVALIFLEIFMKALEHTQIQKIQKSYTTHSVTLLKTDAEAEDTDGAGAEKSQEWLLVCLLLSDLMHLSKLVSNSSDSFG